MFQYQLPVTMLYYQSCVWKLCWWAKITSDHWELRNSVPSPVQFSPNYTERNHPHSQKSQNTTTTGTMFLQFQFLFPIIIIIIHAMMLHCLQEVCCWIIYHSPWLHQQLLGVVIGRKENTDQDSCSLGGWTNTLYTKIKAIIIINIIVFCGCPKKLLIILRWNELFYHTFQNKYRYQGFPTHWLLVAWTE